MDESPASSVADEPSAEGVLLPVLERLGLPVLIFGTVFLLLSLLLTFIVSPDRFPVRMGDKIVRLSDLQAEEYSLKVLQAELLQKRENMLKDSRTPILEQVQKLRAGFDSIGQVLLDIEDVRKSFSLGEIDPISLPIMTFDGEKHQLTLGGEVTDPHGRSVSILSSFVDGLRKLPILQTASGRTPVSDPPEYKALPRDDGGTVSPFTIVITLPDASI